jgi:hypothetical protein
MVGMGFREVVKKFWGYMSCALWTIMGFGVLVFSPTANTQKTLYFSLAGASLALALIQTVASQHRELKTLRSLSPEIDFVIHNVVNHRTGDKEWPWRFAHLLVQVSVELGNLPEVAIEYTGFLVFRGETIPLQLTSDVEQWENY